MSSCVLKLFNNLFIQKDRSPLRLAIEKGIEIINILVTHGANVNVDTEDWVRNL